MFGVHDILKHLLFLALAVSIYSKCSFEVGPDGTPAKVDKDPFLIEGMTLCT